MRFDFGPYYIFLALILIQGNVYNHVKRQRNKLQRDIQNNKHNRLLYNRVNNEKHMGYTR